VENSVGKDKGEGERGGGEMGGGEGEGEGATGERRGERNEFQSEEEKGSLGKKKFTGAKRELWRWNPTPLTDLIGGSSPRRDDSSKQPR